MRPINPSSAHCLQRATAQLGPLLNVIQGMGESRPAVMFHSTVAVRKIKIDKSEFSQTLDIAQSR